MMEQFVNNPYLDVFNLQKSNQYTVANSSYNERIKKLNALKKAIEVTFRKDIIDVLQKDLGKPEVETEMTEIYQVIGDIKHAKKYLHRWMRNEKVKTCLLYTSPSPRD